MSDYNDGNFAGLFNHNAATMLAQFLNTYNQESQAVAFAAADPATTGTKVCVIDGAPVQSLPVEDDADWSSALEADLVQGDAKGQVIATGYSQYLVVFANEDGRLRIDRAGDQALDAAVECKIPLYDPTTWCPIAVVLVDSTGATLGTTDISGMVTIYQVVGSLLPHPDNLPKGI